MTGISEFAFTLPPLYSKNQRKNQICKCLALAKFKQPAVSDRHNMHLNVREYEKDDSTAGILIFTFLTSDSYKTTK